MRHLEPVDPASWYVVLDGEFHGPISRATLVEVLAEHDDDLDAPLWSAVHAEEWTTMLGVPGLAAEVASCRARLKRGHSLHPSDRPPFDESIPKAPPESEASGRLDIAAGLRAVSERPAPQPPPWTGPDRRRRPDRQRPTWLGAGIALGALAVVAFLAPFIDTRPAPIAPRRESLPVVVAPHVVATPEPVLVTVAPAAAPVAPAPVATLAETPPAVVVACDTPAPTTPTEPHRRTTPTALVTSPAPAPTSAASPVVTPGTPTPPASRSIEDLLIAATPPAPARAPAPVVAPRVVPTDAEVVRALESTRDAITACTPVHAVAALRITIHGPTGMVNGVYVDGVFAGTPAGSCIARAVRRARVAPFTQPTFTYSYPFRL